MTYAFETPWDANVWFMLAGFGWGLTWYLTFKLYTFAANLFAS